MLATAVAARWRHDGHASFADARAALVETFAGHHSLSLQQTLYAMGTRFWRRCPSVAEIRLSMPNRHHFVVDLAPFGLRTTNEVFHADDRPYGLIEGAVVRDGAPDAGPVWDPYPLVSRRHSNGGRPAPARAYRRPPDQRPRPARRRSAAPRSRPGRRPRPRASRPWSACSRRRRRREISMSVLADTDEAVVAPACSHSRWNAGRATFSPLRGSAIAPVIDDGLARPAARRRRPRREVLVEHVEVRRPRSAGARSRAAAGEVLDEARGDLRADVLDRCSASSPASATSSSDAKPGAAEPRRRALRGHRDREADQRAAQADLAAGVDRVDHAVGRDLADAVELEQPLPRQRVEVRRVLQQSRLGQALDPDRPDGLDVGRRPRRPVDQPAHGLRRAGDVGAEQLAAVALLGQRLRRTTGTLRRDDLALLPRALARRRARRPRTGSRRPRGARARCRRSARRGPG